MKDFQFYPTPDLLALKMTEPYKGKVNTILDPSAGKGDLLSVFSQHKASLYAIEINPEFQYILQGKGFEFITNDFLSYQKDRYFELILMNPPFAEGTKHFLKAWDIADKYVCCLLNAETIKNPYTLERKKLVQIAEQYGSIEIIENIYFPHLRLKELAIIRVEKPKSGFINFDFTTEKTDFNVDDISQFPSKVDKIQSLVDRKNAIMQKAKEFVQLAFELQVLIGEDAYNFREYLKGLEDDKGQFFNRFMKKVNERFWKEVFKVDLFRNYFSSEQMQKFYTTMQYQSSVAFTKENVFSLLNLFLLNMKNFKIELIKSVFEELTRHYHDNKEYIEGWKSNSSYKLNKRVIIPDVVSFDYGYFRFNWYTQKENLLRDFDKAMCYVTGKRFENIKSIERALTEGFNKKETTVYSTFFKIRYYKKGTVHLWFKSEKERELFNRAVSSNALPHETR